MMLQPLSRLAAWRELPGAVEVLWHTRSDGLGLRIRVAGCSSIASMSGKHSEVGPVMGVLGSNGDSFTGRPGCGSDVSGREAAGQVVPTLIKVWVHLQSYPKASLSLLNLSVLEERHREIVENFLVADHEACAKLVQGSSKKLFSHLKSASHDLELTNAIEGQRTQRISVRASDQGLHS